MAEEIGRKVAQELSDRFARVGMEILTQQSRLNFALQTLSSLRRAISEELRGFNSVAPQGFQLNMLSGQSCLVFTVEAKLALTLKVNNAHIRLVPAATRVSNWMCESEMAANARECCDFVVTHDEKGSYYRRASLAGSAYAPVLTEAEFIEGVIRVACSQSFERA